MKYVRNTYNFRHTIANQRNYAVFVKIMLMQLKKGHGSFISVILSSPEIDTYNHYKPFSSLLLSQLNIYTNAEFKFQTCNISPLILITHWKYS